MALPIHPHNPLARGCAPGQEHNALGTLRGHEINDPLRELLPAPVRVAVGLVRAHCQAGVEQQDAAVGPGR